jgi:DamX protein
LNVKDEVWLLHRNPEHYTLQLVAARKEKAVLAYLKHHMRSGQVAIFHSYFKGGDWYSLVYGIYPTRFAAEQALRQLPDAVRKEGPWVRRVVSVQNAIKAPIPTVPVQ